MILTGKKIIQEHTSKNIIIEPFDVRQINPNSYDFRLGNKIIVYKNNIIDSKLDNPTEEILIPKQGLILSPDKIYLGHTLEKMGSCKYVPIIRGKSSIGRLGIYIVITADLIDIGSVNQWTLMLHCVQPVKVYPNMLIGQVTFWTVEGEIVLYNGKYQESVGPKASQSYRDFLN